MVDQLSPDGRSALMGRIKGKDTQPEQIVRRLTYRLGYRFRLHRRDLPGCPDLVFSGRRKVIFVHGCFWHRHSGCSRTHNPKSNQIYWRPKLARNVQRDQAARKALKTVGWEVLIVWECETAHLEPLEKRLRQFLENRSENQP